VLTSIYADKSYKKQALRNSYKTSPTGGPSHAKGIIVEKIEIEAKQPNAAIGTCVRVQLIKNGKKFTAFMPNDACPNFVDENDELTFGFGRHGKAKGVVPGVRFKVVKVAGVGVQKDQATTLTSSRYRYSVSYLCRKIPVRKYYRGIHTSRLYTASTV